MSDRDSTHDANQLHRLCGLFGISAHYDDVWGKRHQVAPSSLVALLGEFGVHLDGVVTVEKALESAEGQAWRQSLPPVIAIQACQSEWHVLLRLPPSVDWIRWHLREEGGALHEGEIQALSLPEVRSGELDGLVWRERRLTLAVPVPIGYHRLTVDGLNGEALVVSAPESCYRPDSLRNDGRVWGPAVQLYSLRSKRNWGIGDFTDLAHLIRLVAERGADIIGLNPLHALFPHNPAHASPYSPSSRQHLNALYIDVEAVADFPDCEAAQRLVRSPEFQATLTRLRDAVLVDHGAVSAAKFQVLELLFAHFKARHLSEDGRSARDDEGRAFLTFVTERGEALRRHAVFEALQARFHGEDPSVWGPPAWPEEYRDPEGAAVRAFADAHFERVRYHQYLQWIATLQLGRAAGLGRELGMSVGLYLDLAVSVDRAGSDAWGERETFAAHASMGAPPDDFNPRGQGWGLPPPRPDRMRDSQYRLLIETLRANMRGAGALRIDHVMGLMRLFWIPPGETARDGAYVHYRLDEALAIVALESQRHRCMVIGEDLGTVPDEVRTAMARFDVLSYRLLYFERLENGDFKAPGDYPASALVAIGTHDLAPLPGWLLGQDLSLRLQLGLIEKVETFETLLLARAQERVRLLLAVLHAGLLSPREVAESLGAQPLSARVVEAIHAFLARAPCAVMIVHLEDSLGVTDQINMPATTHEQPNWRRKLPLDLQALSDDTGIRSLSRRLAALRPRSPARARPGSPINAKVPRATYRIQFNKEFGFDAARRILPYLERLGVSHVYCSPISRARAGSTHGYDVVAHAELNPELGGREAFERFSTALRAHGMGLVLDLVPNHMGVSGGENAWWTDVLENGPASAYSEYFDIDWEPLNPELTGKVLLPVLGDHYGSVLLRGEIVLRFEAETGSLAFGYFEHRFPLCPESYPLILMRAQARIEDADLAASLASTATAFGHLPGRGATAAEAIAERARDKEQLKARLARLAVRHSAVARSMAAAVAELNLEDARDKLHALIEGQAYRLSFWRVAADEINYRRFFDINELAALRMERDEVFAATQSFTLDLAAAGVVDGLRIDHPDGLYDPAKYFSRLQEEFARRSGLVLPDWDGGERPARPLYIVAEKIPAPHEEVPESWPIHGITGYRFANVVNGLLVDRSAATRFETIWRNFTGKDESFEEVAYAAKREIIRNALASELNVLATELVRIARSSRATRDYTLNALRRALAEVAACLPVYRTYIRDEPSAQDVRYVDWALRDAARRSHDADLSVFDFVRQALLGRAVQDAPEDLRQRVRRFANKFQQYSAPVAAKGVEDTAFYRYFPLSSLNEVGGDPGEFGVAVEDFHAFCSLRAQKWPHSLLATSTHDSKRSEDVRHRIDVLSEIPAEWRLSLRRFQNLNRRVRRAIEAEGAPEGAPSACDEYLLYQTLLGTLPVNGLDERSLPPYRDRIAQYMLKAAREAKIHTRWTHPDEAYEGALEGFVRGLLARLDDNPFLDQLQALGATLARFGALNSLTATLLKLTSPGVPDTYQGHEVISLALVDPDNRRPVDYAALDQGLRDLEGLDPAELPALAATPEDGRAKLWIAWRTLTLRRELPALFRDGGYTPLRVEGRLADHVVAFARVHEGTTLVVLVGRLFARLLGRSEKSPRTGAVWEDAAVEILLPDATRLDNVLTGETLEVNAGRIEVGAAFARLPAAALIARPK